VILEHQGDICGVEIFVERMERIEQLPGETVTAAIERVGALLRANMKPAEVVLTQRQLRDLQAEVAEYAKLFRKG
jgi:hypothetical protein